MPLDVLMKMLNEKFERQAIYDNKLRIADQNNVDKIDDLVSLINFILHKYGINDSIDKTQVQFNADYVGNITGIDDKKLSSLIFEKIYPTTRRTFSHYTKFDKGRAVIEKSELWLFNLLQNFNADEFRLFYREHGIDGYEQESEVFGVLTGYRPLMAEIFALCLTSEENTDPQLWDYFGGQGTGLKLTFETNSHIPDFREVYYSNIHTQQPISLLKELFTEIKSQFGYTFNFNYISKIGAFYIKGCFRNEQEYRFLIKRTSDNYNAWGLQPVAFNGDISYIILPFKSPYATFKLVKVERGPNGDSDDFKNLIPLINARHPGAQIIF